MVLSDRRIDAINIPDLIERSVNRGKVNYNDYAMKPEQYADLLKRYGKEIIINAISPRMHKEEFVDRILTAYENGIKNYIVVGKERSTDVLPGYSVPDAIKRLSRELNGFDDTSIGGICIFHREHRGAAEYNPHRKYLDEYERVSIKARNGCKFVTSQIVYDAPTAIRFLERYNTYCGSKNEKPLTVLISLAPISSPTLLNLLIEKLDVYIPKNAVKDLLKDPDRIGEKSIEISKSILYKIVSYVRENGINVPLGLQIEQIGLKNYGLALKLLDKTYEVIKIY